MGDQLENSSRIRMVSTVCFELMVHIRRAYRDRMSRERGTRVSELLGTPMKPYTPYKTDALIGQTLARNVPSRHTYMPAHVPHVSTLDLHTHV